MHILPGDAPVGGFPYVVLKTAGLLTAADHVDRIAQHRRSVPLPFGESVTVKM